jgi:hypothetical protein
MYSVLMAVQLGMAVIAGSVVAQRFIRRQEDNVWQFPPLAELTVSALVVVGLCIVLRIGWPLVPDLLNTASISLSQSLVQFGERWPFVLLPFMCTLSIGLTCAYLGRLSWSWIRLALLGGLLNAAAFAIAGLLISQLQTRAGARFGHVEQMIHVDFAQAIRRLLCGPAVEKWACRR